MSQPPGLILYNSFGSWAPFEEAIYAEFLATVPNANLTFNGAPVRTQFRPVTKDRASGFWHLISEAPNKYNHNEDDRIPDLKRCERIRWVAWCIENAGQADVSWWENQRKGETHIVIWAEKFDFSVVLAKRTPTSGENYYLLKTAYCLKPHRAETFARERDAYLAAQKG